MYGFSLVLLFQSRVPACRAAAGGGAWCAAVARAACAPPPAAASASCAAATAGHTRRCAGSGDEPAGDLPSISCLTTLDPAKVSVVL